MNDLVLVLSSAPDDDRGAALAAKLVESRLAACVSRLPGATSVYHWEGRLEEARETLLLIKTTRQKVGQLEQRLAEWHPYEVPEIIRLASAEAWPPYLAWVKTSVEAQG